MARKVTYMGYNERMVESILSSDDFELRQVVYVPRRVNEKFLSLVEENGIEVLTLVEKADLKKLPAFIPKENIVLMYKFEFILPQSLVNEYKIINFHGGRLKTNRGSHPIAWTILNQEKETVFSMYQLTGGIDLGLLIGEYNVNLDGSETPITLNSKLQDGIPNLLKRLNSYLEGEKLNPSPQLIEAGNYNRKVKQEDFTIDPIIDDFNSAYAKVRSQVGYDGAYCKVDDNTFLVKKWDVIEENQPLPCDAEHCIAIKGGSDKRTLLLFI